MESFDLTPSLQGFVIPYRLYAGTSCFWPACRRSSQPTALLVKQESQRQHAVSVLDAGCGLWLGTCRLPASMEVLELNVGGSLFTTSRTTLARDPNSMLARMFEGGLDPAIRDGANRWAVVGLFSFNCELALCLVLKARPDC